LQFTIFIIVLLLQKVLQWVFSEEKNEIQITVTVLELNKKEKLRFLGLHSM
jgi:hypothetical protein